jgi:hypothetical protein
MIVSVFKIFRSGCIFGGIGNWIADVCEIDLIEKLIKGIHLLWTLEEELNCTPATILPSRYQYQRSMAAFIPRDGLPPPSIYEMGFRRHGSRIETRYKGMEPIHNRSVLICFPGKSNIYPLLSRKKLRDCFFWNKVMGSLITPKKQLKLATTTTNLLL